MNSYERLADDLEELLDDLLNVDGGMSGKECDFIDDLDQTYRGRNLTERQADWLRAIHERVCG